ncbi:MAG: bifunctional isocitrate dehydrogenase kinase/phosphatase, partial [Thermoanaerobaculia bacterium]|nr:bifunctional isocitrate dehydrogenase kinase/phosphatase [Thermoanaerobaculia bacterium]
MGEDENLLHPLDPRSRRLRNRPDLFQLAHPPSVFARRVDPAIDYVADDFPLPYKGWEMASARLYAVRRVDAGVLTKVLENVGFHVPFRALEADAQLAAKRVEAGLLAAFGSAEVDGFETVRPVFIRNKAAYIVGRVRRGERVLPVVIALLNRRDGLRVDAVLTTEEETSTVFSFARWYFHAEVPNPREVIGFLQSILPRKRVSELYLSLGYDKHGKTEFYRDLMAQIAAVPEQFVVAPGQPGQVMAVFTLPSYEFVFKIIKDVFPPTKHTNRREIVSRYREVQRHDRVGRLVDFQEFEHLSFPAARFSPELLEELLRVAGKTVWLRGSEVVVDHVYVGRRVTPLDLFVRDAPEA